MKNQKEKPFLKKGDLFVISNVQPYRNDYMGDTLERYNESRGVDNPMVINGELWEYDEKYCKEDEVIRLSHKCDKDYGYDDCNKNMFPQICGFQRAGRAVRILVVCSCYLYRFHPVDLSRWVCLGHVGFPATFNIKKGI